MDARPPESGLGGRLVVRTPPRGGCGNAFMLMVFLIVFPALLTPGVVRSFDRLVLLPPMTGDGLREGSCDVDGARNPLLGKLGVEAVDWKSETVGMLPVLLRDLVGRAGKAVVGGPYDGLDGLGIEAAILRNYGCLNSVDLQRRIVHRLLVESS